MQNNLSRKHFFIFLKGMAMGAADVVPGVSGGTIAFISGIYQELLDSISQLNYKAFKVLKKEGFISFWTRINGFFLLSLFLGIGVSVISLAKGISWLLATQAVLLWSFFFGLVIASIVFIAKSIENIKITDYLWLIIGIGVAFYITGLPIVENSQEPWYLFLSGALAICAMILPGISGAFILVLLGSYETILNAVHERQFITVAIVGSGSLLGLILFSRFLKWTFNRFKNQTLFILTGFIIGSLSKIWPWKEVVSSKMIGKKEIVLVSENVWPSNFSEEPHLLPAITLAVFGFFLIFILERSAKTKQFNS